MFTNLKTQFTNTFKKKQIQCPNCSQKLNVPLKFGKVLRITCSKCRSKFDISFKMPSVNKHTFNRLKSNLFDNNSNSFYSRYKIVIWISIGLMIFNIFTSLFLPPTQKPNSMDKQLQIKIEVIIL